MNRTAALTALVACLWLAVPAGAQQPEVEGYPALRTVGELRPAARSGPAVAVNGFPRLREPLGLAFPSPASVRSARRYAATRKGRVAFAVADSRAGMRGSAAGRRYRSASLVKAMLLVARLQKDPRSRIPGTETNDLDAMIRVSDNASATAVYRRLGAGPVRALARRAGMRSFGIAGSWSEATVTAADQARFFLSLDRLMPAGERRGYGRYLLSNVAPQQRWGIPSAGRRRGWRVYLKGGWRPAAGGEIVHQAGLLERGGRRVAVAVLSDRNPSEPYGHQTVRGITERLLRPAPKRRARASTVRPGALAPLSALGGYRAPEPPALRPLRAGRK